MSSERFVCRLQAHDDVKRPTRPIPNATGRPNAAPAKGAQHNRASHPWKFAAKSKSFDAFCRALKSVDRSPTNTGFDDRVEFTSLDRKGYDEVAGKRPLRTLRSSAEWRGVVQGRVVANLRPDNEAFDLFRDRRLNGNSDGQRAVGRRSAADCHSQWIAMFDPDKIQIAREGGDKEPVIVAPDLAASCDLQPIVDRVCRVLRPTIAGRVEPIVTNVVEVGRQGELVGCLPDDGHVIEIAQSTVGIDARKYNGRHIRIFRADMGGCSNSQRTVQQIQAETTMEGRGPVVVATIEAIEVIAEGRVHARVYA